MNLTKGEKTTAFRSFIKIESMNITDFLRLLHLGLHDFQDNINPSHLTPSFLDLQHLTFNR